MKEETIKDVVNPALYDTFKKSEKHLIHLGKVMSTMFNLEQAGEKMNNTNQKDRSWYLQLNIQGMNVMHVGSSDEMRAEIWETVKQLVTLLEAIHYSERKQTIIDFNNSLKESDDGKSAEK